MQTRYWLLSVKSADDEVKTMKLVFTQNGTDRTGETDDWISLLGQEPVAKKPRRAAPPQREPEPMAEEEPEEEPDEAPPARRLNPRSGRKNCTRQESRSRSTNASRR